MNNPLLIMLQNSKPEELKKAGEILGPFIPVPKKKEEEDIENFLSLPEFKKKLPVQKDSNWVREVLLAKPVFHKWVFNLSRGKGFKAKINPLAVEWVKKHKGEIDWTEKRPRVR